MIKGKKGVEWIITVTLIIIMAVIAGILIFYFAGPTLLSVGEKAITLPGQIFQ